MFLASQFLRKETKSRFKCNFIGLKLVIKLLVLLSLVLCPFVLHYRRLAAGGDKSHRPGHTSHLPPSWIFIRL